MPEPNRVTGGRRQEKKKQETLLTSNRVGANRDGNWQDVIPKHVENMKRKVQRLSNSHSATQVCDNFEVYVCALIYKHVLPAILKLFWKLKKHFENTCLC